MVDVRVLPAQRANLSRYLDLLEEVDEWLDSKGIKESKPGVLRGFEDYFAESIRREEVYMAFLGNDLVGTLRLLSEDPIVWPEIRAKDGLYVYNLVVRRAWAGRRLGRRMLEWAESRTASMGRNYLRLDCFANNSVLRRYYEDAGFANRGEIDAAYPEPIGTLRLQRFEKALSIGP